MINLLRFLDLNINEQAEYVWQGKYLATRQDEVHRILLYNLGEFYAEVFYEVKGNKISYIKGFRSNSHLVPYINLM